ncbi:MAG: pyridoxal 5'-phosphate synthase, partial [Bacteroidetes bacterium]|nr:pyridoxal 5'-phosphate synthase [Bacteroidota bacterium]
MDIAGIRKEYTKKVLTEDSVDKDALVQFNNWFSEALHSDVPEPNAMTLATATKDGIPAARIVLLKGVDAGFVFFTNYKSHKGNNLEVNPNAALVFFWQELERQVRITGKVEKISTQESDDYYNSRPYESRLGAWASPQSNEITKAELEANFN